MKEINLKYQVPYPVKRMQVFFHDSRVWHFYFGGL